MKEQGLDISNLANCVEEVRLAALDSDSGPKDPLDYSELRGRLEACRDRIPPLYRETVFDPYVQAIERLGQNGFNKVLLRDPERSGQAGLMLDIAHAILQHGEKYNERATGAFQEVVSDLYDGFLSEEDRVGVKKPDYCIIPPLVKWGNPTWGPYTWPTGATEIFGLETAIVNLPPANARRGLLAWVALGHETAGHDILGADEGLREELAECVWNALQDKGLHPDLPGYWANRIDETASDVMGILNMGPAAGIGLIGYFRGLNAAWGEGAVLRNIGSEDCHPADILRGYLAAYTTGLLSFSAAEEWEKLIEAETDRDLSTICLEGKEVSAEDAKKSAKLVAKALVRKKMLTLQSHALGQIQNWRSHDEKVVTQLRKLLTTANPLPPKLASGIYAAHVAAAAVVEGLTQNANIPVIFDRMQAILKTMHDSNPAWGPLYVAHPGNLMTRVVYSCSE